MQHQIAPVDETILKKWKDNRDTELRRPAKPLRCLILCRGAMDICFVPDGPGKALVIHLCYFTISCNFTIIVVTFYYEFMHLLILVVEHLIF